MSKIIFYGALGRKGQDIVGGGESGNLKTIDILSDLGHHVIRIPKPYPQKTFVGLVIYFFRLQISIFKLFIKLITNRDISSIHISGFYMHLIYFELQLIWISKLFRKQCVYELRGGGVEEAFVNGGKLYKFCFKKAVCNASLVLSQGNKYILFLNQLGVKDARHYPNFVTEELLKLTPSSIDRGNISIPQIVYFGRISQTKNIEFIIEIAHILVQDRFDFRLEIIGKGDEEYLKKINALIQGYNLSEKIIITPAQFGVSLWNKLSKKHFFVFPSKEPREGQSNALTEAMAMGLVPVCSNAGFNKEVVNNYKLVVDEMSVEKYVSVIKNIWLSGAWEDFSQQVQKRVKISYTQNVGKSLFNSIYG